MSAGPVTPGRLVVFDLDGTLIDSARDLAAAVNSTLAALAPDAPEIPLHVVQSFVGDGARLLLRRSLDRAGLPHEPEEVLPLFLERYQERLLDTTRLYPGVAETLECLVGTLAVLTNKPGVLSRAILDGLGVGDRFFRVYGAGDVPGRKPDPAGLLRLAAEAGVPPARTVMVGDSALDVLTGRAAGARTVGVTYGFAPESLHETPPDVLIDDLRGLADVLERLLWAG